MKYIKKFMAGATISAMVSLNLWAFSQFFNEDKIMKLPTLIPYKSQSPDFELTLSFDVFGCLSYNFGCVDFFCSCCSKLSNFKTLWPSIYQSIAANLDFMRIAEIEKVITAEFREWWKNRN